MVVSRHAHSFELVSATECVSRLTGNAVDDDIGELRGLVVADDVVVIIVRHFELSGEDAIDKQGDKTGDFGCDKRDMSVRIDRFDKETEHGLEEPGVPGKGDDLVKARVWNRREKYERKSGRLDAY
ncbi:hypothetical protein EDD15DRAFT_2192701 [Pisolithus albus]|nr:hypothetical protein EDD15DRAFT_2192701 [Pisolithus albus]